MQDQMHFFSWKIELACSYVHRQQLGPRHVFIGVLSNAWVKHFQQPNGSEMQVLHARPDFKSIFTFEFKLIEKKAVAAAAAAAITQGS